METRELICIGCPLGCPLTVTVENNEVTSVSGNTCPRGDAYARKEVTNPTRIVTSTVRVSGGVSPMVSCKTASDIPKGKIFDVTKALQAVCVPAPVTIGDVVLANAADTGVDVIATKNIDKLS
jgi:CxxC motif-containing protein